MHLAQSGAWRTRTLDRGPAPPKGGSAPHQGGSAPPGRRPCVIHRQSRWVSPWNRFRRRPRGPTRELAQFGGHGPPGSAWARGSPPVHVCRGTGPPGSARVRGSPPVHVCRGTGPPGGLFPPPSISQTTVRKRFLRTHDAVAGCPPREPTESRRIAPWH